MAEQTQRKRDPRLDFFRGLAMLIIFIAHVPRNLWGQYIPARFGYSDATEMFVFCSGFAAAIAFGGTFVRSGFWVGTARILYRCWQVYAAHIGMFFFITAVALFGTRILEGKSYIARLNLNRFFSLTADAMAGLFTLTYVPNYFDILPMYIVALALVSFGVIAQDFLSNMAPVSRPASICMMVIPVSLPPARIARWMGAAPRQRGNNEA